MAPAVCSPIVEHVGIALSIMSPMGAIESAHINPMAPTVCYPIVEHVGIALFAIFHEWPNEHYRVRVDHRE